MNPQKGQVIISDLILGKQNSHLSIPLGSPSQCPPSWSQQSLKRRLTTAPGGVKRIHREYSHWWSWAVKFARQEQVLVSLLFLQGWVAGSVLQGKRSRLERPLGEERSGKNLGVSEVHVAQHWRPSQCFSLPRVRVTWVPKKAWIPRPN